MKRLAALTALVVLIISLVPLASLSQPPSTNAPIRLKVTSFRPGLGEAPSIPPGLTATPPRLARAGYYLVQFVGPVEAAWKEALEKQGAEILGYVPEFAFKVRMTEAVASQVRQLNSVNWVGLFHPAYKLSPEVQRQDQGLYRVRIESGANRGPAAAAIASSGAQVLGRDGAFVVVGANGAQLEAIARVLDVAWIESYVPKEKHNEYGAGVILGANTANASGYDGSSQIAAVADTGLGNGTATGAHPDIPSSRVVSIYNWPGQTNICFQTIVDDGPQDVDSGHGTHTAVSVLGDGGASGEGQGVAPAAGLVFQATENWAYISNYCQLFGGWPAQGYFLTGLPDDLHTMYQQAYADGARVHSNSWGSAQAGVYTLDSANTDDFVWTNPDMTITFSAGNAGTDANANGVVDNDSIGSPATAKNVITVGASENDRQGNYQCDTGLTYTSHDAYQTGQTCQSMGGNQAGFLGTWGQRYPDSFPAEPLASDVTAGNQEQMAAWSSRGPTDDGRIKPDLVAPGTWVLSGFSGMYQEGYGDPVNPRNGIYQWDGWGMPFNGSYKYMGGTSMANPIAAGAATVVRDFYQKANNHNASAALVKATLINSAVDLLDENNDGANDNDFPIPNAHEGWGRVNLAAATDGSHEYVDAANGVATGGNATYQYNVAASGSPLKISLVWSDYPSTEAAAQNLVNNLDLVVTAPGGAKYRGNVFSSGWSQTGGSADTVNNVENVYVQSAAAGTWTVEVRGTNVPQGPQPFALVVDGDLGTPGPTPTPTVTPLPTNTPAPTDTPVPGTSMHVGDLDGASSPAARNRWNATVTITVHDDTESPVPNATVSGTWSDGATGGASCVTDGSGQCSVAQNDLKSNVASVTFTVDNITHASNTYNATANPDPDGDSDGTTVIVYQTGAPEPTSTPEPTATPGGPGVVMHVGDLDGSSAPALRGRWDATVTVTVHDAGENPVTSATVDGAWSGGATGGGTCVTDATGQCSITKSNLKSNVSSVTFSVNTITLTGSTYDAGANHDQDGDSDGTSITILQP